MEKICILTDSNSGITQKEADELGIKVVPMPFYINEKLFYEDIDLNQEQFYVRLKEKCRITTSMPLVGNLTDLWEELLKEYDNIIYIPMSSGLSASCQTAIMLSDEYDGRVTVVDNQRISVTQKQATLEARELANQGLSVSEIYKRLMETKFDSRIYIAVDTLEYLKEGGRLTPAVAAIGTFLRIKPVLNIYGEKLDKFAMARTMKQAKLIMIGAIEKDMKEFFHDEAAQNVRISIAHTDNYEEACLFREELLERFPNREIWIDPLSLSVSCHIGPGALAVTCSKELVKL